jgi:hypothetical protein
MEFAATARRYAMESGVAAESAVKSARTGTAETKTSTEDRPRSEAATIEAVEPRTRADKYSAGEIVRAIVAIRSAVVRSEPIVAVGADRSRTGEDGTNLSRDLCMRAACYDHEKPYQSHVF